jgi:hypothetical protein
VTHTESERYVTSGRNELAKYKVRFFVECALVATKDLDFCFRGHVATFMFSERKADDKGCSAEVCCEGDGWKQAASVAMDEILPPILDIIAIQRHTPMLLGTPTQVVKAELGIARRRAILINKKAYPTTCDIDQDMVMDINKVLQGGGTIHRTALRWLRNAYRPLPIRDRFVFAWLALENLAGPKVITKKCPECGFTFLPFSSADRQRAFAVLKEVDPELEEKDFGKWWNNLRNAVFHGGREPDSKFLGELRTVSDRILQDVNEYVGRQMGLDFRFRTKIPVADEQVYHRHHFIEFDCAKPGGEFASIVPDVEVLEQIIESHGDTSTLMQMELVSWAETDDW